MNFDLEKIIRNQKPVFNSSKEMWTYIYLIAPAIYITYLFIWIALPKIYNICIDGLADNDMLLLNEVLKIALFCWVISTFNYFVVIPWVEKQSLATEGIDGCIKKKK